MIVSYKVGKNIYQGIPMDLKEERTYHHIASGVIAGSYVQLHVSKIALLEDKLIGAYKIYKIPRNIQLPLPEYFKFHVGNWKENENFVMESTQSQYYDDK